MKKQYRYILAPGLMVCLLLYHDGKLVEERKLWQGDEFIEEIEKIESEGYTYGYKKQDVEDVKRRYEYMLKTLSRRKMNKESWYKAKLNEMDVFTISYTNDWIVDYDKSRGMYRVSYFQDNHFVDELV